MPIEWPRRSARCPPAGSQYCCEPAFLQSLGHISSMIPGTLGSSSVCCLSKASSRHNVGRFSGGKTTLLGLNDDLGDGVVKRLNVGMDVLR